MKHKLHGSTRITEYKKFRHSSDFNAVIRHTLTHFSEKRFPAALGSGSGCLHFILLTANAELSEKVTVQCLLRHSFITITFNYKQLKENVKWKSEFVGIMHNAKCIIHNYKIQARRASETICRRQIISYLRSKYIISVEDGYITFSAGKYITAVIYRSAINYCLLKVLHVYPALFAVEGDFAPTALDFDDFDSCAVFECADDFTVRGMVITDIKR